MFSRIREWWYSLIGYFYVKYQDREKSTEPKIKSACHKCQYMKQTAYNQEKIVCGAYGRAECIDVRNKFGLSNECPFYVPKRVGLLRWVLRKLI